MSGERADEEECAGDSEASTEILRALRRPFALLLLGIEPAHGYRLRALLTEAGLSAESGAVYRLLHRLEAEGYLACTAEPGPGPDRTGNRYR